MTMARVRVRPHGVTMKPMAAVPVGAYASLRRQEALTAVLPLSTLARLAKNTKVGDQSSSRGITITDNSAKNIVVTNMSC